MATGIFVLAVRLVRPPGYVVDATIKTCWVAGLLNLVADLIGARFGLWHYTLDGLLFGLPLDFYASVSLFYGGVVSLGFWWIATRHDALVRPFVIALPFYGLARDSLATRFTGDTILVWDSPYWWLADFCAWAIVLWTVLFLFTRVLRQQEPH